MTETPKPGLGNVSALLELCDVQQHTIDRLQRALAEHEETEADRHMLKRMLAHELRTPLAAVIGTLHTLALPALDDEKREDFRTRALRQAEQLNDLIDDILTMSDPHSAAVERAPQEWVAVEQLVDDVRIQISETVDTDRLVAELPDGLMIRTVPGRVRQILVNLLVNAAKFGPDGTPVRLVATRLDDRMVFEVVDEGPGIDPETADSLFEAFRRGEQTAGDVEGVGLGLYLVRNLARSLAGTVSLVSREPQGLLVRVELPQKRLEDAVPPAKPARHLEVVPTLASNDAPDD